ncbi:hypothetical protein SELMODRAFT_19099, partial [Selaginella moellendorffii]
YILHMQNDCNLVLYYRKIVVWNTKTDKKGVGCFLKILKNGSLVIYDKNINVIWSNMYWKNDGVVFSLCVENTGHVVVY